MKITLPKLFDPRDYQHDVMRAFFIEQMKRFVCVFHRRAGKDRVALNIMIAAAMQRKGLYYYAFPTQTQARKSIWEGIGADGVKFLDQIPKEIIEGNINKSEMKVELVNGSIIRFVGTDQYDKLRGSNPVGVIFSEYAEQNPMAYETVIRPILSENGGWAMFIYTPKGMNHGYDLYNMALNNPAWYVSLLTADDTKRADGSPVITKESVEEERKSGMSDDSIQQEYYCSFTASNVGAIYALQFKRAYEEDRIKDFPVDSSIPVYTFWDVGRDGTAIWFIQRDGEYWRAIDYYENQGQHINHYLEALIAFRKKHRIIYIKHLLPHDAAQKPSSTETSIIGHFNKHLLPSDIVPCIKKKDRSIEAGRVAFDKVIFHKSNCSIGLHMLQSYRRIFNRKLKIYSEEPLHDNASHCSDAFQGFGMALMLHMLDEYDVPNGGVLLNRAFTGAL